MVFRLFLGDCFPPSLCYGGQSVTSFPMTLWSGQALDALVRVNSQNPFSRFKIGLFFCSLPSALFSLLFSSSHFLIFSSSSPRPIVPSSYRSFVLVRCFRFLMFPGENASCKHRIIDRHFVRNRRFLFAPAH